MSKQLFADEEVPRLVTSRYWFDSCFERVAANKAIPLEDMEKAVSNCMSRSMQAHERVARFFVENLTVQQAAKQ